MTEPSSALGCILAVLTLIGAILLQLVFAGALYASIPILGVVLALRIWEWDHVSAKTILIASILILVFALYAASIGLETKETWETFRPKLISGFALIIAFEFLIYALRVNSENPAHRKAGKSALVFSLMSIAAGLLLAHLTS